MRPFSVSTGFLFYFVPLFDGHENRCQCTTRYRMTLFSLHRRHLPSLQCSICTRAHWHGERQGEICAAPYGGPRHFGAFDPVVSISNMLSNGLAFRMQRVQNLISPSAPISTDMQAQRGGAQKQLITSHLVCSDTQKGKQTGKTGERPTQALACRRHQAPATYAPHQLLPVRLLQALIRSASAQKCSKMPS